VIGPRALAGLSDQLLGALVLGEPLGFAALAGLALIFAGAALVNRRPGERATAAAD